MFIFIKRKKINKKYLLFRDKRHSTSDMDKSQEPKAMWKLIPFCTSRAISKIVCLISNSLINFYTITKMCFFELIFLLFRESQNWLVFSQKNVAMKENGVFTCLASMIVISIKKKNYYYICCIMYIIYKI